MALMLLMFVAVDVCILGTRVTAVLLCTGRCCFRSRRALRPHALRALGFAAFVVLSRAPARPVGVARRPAAFCRYALVVESPLGIVALVLAAYVASGQLGAASRRYGGGACRRAPARALQHVGLRVTDDDELHQRLERPVGRHRRPDARRRQLDRPLRRLVPDLRTALSLLPSEKGLLVVTPLCVAALLGLPALWRAGRRAEPLVCAAVPALFLAYNASYYLPFGGQGPGPRFLVPALPFLALPLAAALTRRLLPTLVLGLISVA